MPPQSSLSALARAARTAELAGLTEIKHDPDLWEWDYGGYEGLTTPQIREERPGWYLWRDGVIPGDAAHPGETVQQVGERVDRVLARVEPWLADGDIALVAHGHVLRVLTARWLRLDPSDGRLFRSESGKPLQPSTWWQVRQKVRAASLTPEGSAAAASIAPAIRPNAPSTTARVRPAAISRRFTLTARSPGRGR